MSTSKEMNKRINILRKKSLEARAEISDERARLLTEFYQSEIPKRKSVPVQRALWLKYLFENKSLYLGENELIIGERGEKPKATSTYPEICLHSIDDLETLNSRKKQPFTVSDKTKKLYLEKIIPYGKGKTMREKIFAKMKPQWKAAFEAGVFTEFQEQRAPGHTVLGGDMFKKGFLDLKNEIQTSLNNKNNKTPETIEQLKAMDIAADAVIIYANRYAQKINELINKEKDEKRKAELCEIKNNCEQIPANKPLSFWQALQHYWFIHLSVISEVNPWDSFNPGRLDRNLYPFYKNDIEKGILTREKAKELLQAFWIKFNNHPAPPKIGVTAKESSTYTDFALINLGGVDEKGNDAVNELTYLILDVIEEMRLLQPGSMIQVSKKNPDDYIKRALKIIQTGFGQPSVFNTEAIIKEMLRQGKSLIDARNGGTSGCVETGAFGKESYILTGYFNIPKILELTLNNGKDPLSGKQVGLQTGPLEQFKDFDGLFEAFSKQLQYFIDIKIAGNRTIEQLYAKHLPVPFLSLLIGECINNAKDYNAGGAKYNSSYIQGVGMGSITDSLAALKHHLYDKKSLSAKMLKDAMKSNFEGHEEVRDILIYQTPKYGNDDDCADELTRKVFDLFFNAADGKPNTKGGHFRINLLPTTVHVYFGSMMGAMPDGRKAHEPLSEGISPVQGMDTKGPTAVLKSAAKIDQYKTGGTLLNQKFTPQIFNDTKGMESILHLIRTYFKMGGHHIQFNVVTAETLKQARKEPEKHRDLIVRVAGYSDYFIDLTRELQDEIIRRTEHGE